MVFRPSPESTDIRAVLKARIDEVRLERQQLQGRLKDLEVAETGYARALDAENRRFHQESLPGLSEVHTDTEVPVEAALDALFGGSTKDFLLKTMSDGQNWSLDALKGVAEQQNLFVPAGSSLGRMLHGALLGLKQSGQVVMVGRGVWRKA